MKILTKEQLEILNDLKSMAEAGTLKGIYNDIPSDVYHAGPGTSSSQVKPYVARINGYEYETPDNDLALKIGRATHTYILEPHLFNSEFSIGLTPKDHRDFITPMDYSMIKEMAANFKKNTQAMAFLNAGQKELTCYSLCQNTGILRKARADIFIQTPDLMIIPDIKTTRSTQAYLFTASCRKYLYRVSAAYYRMVFQAEIPTRLLAQSYLIACAKESNRDTKVFEVDEKSIAEGEREVTEALQVIQREKEIGQSVWAEYDSRIKKIAI